MSLVTPLLTTIVLIYAIYYTLKRWFRFHQYVKKVDKIPGPKALPIFGNALSFESDKAAFTRQLTQFNDTYGKNGIFRIWFGHIPIIYLTKGETAEALLNSNKLIEKSSNYIFMKTWLGEGLLISTGDKWRSRRKMITPAFHFSILNNFIDVFNDQANVLLDQLSIASKGSDSFDIFPYIGRCTLDIICETAMGVKIHAQTNHDSEYVKAVKRISEIIIEYEKYPWLWIKPIFKLVRGSAYAYCLKILKDFTHKVIMDRLEQADAQTIKKDGKKQAFLDLLIFMQTEHKLTIGDIVEEVDTFMFEGHDTTASGLSWTIFLLGLHPHVQDKIMAEMESIFGDSDRGPTADDLKEMKYLEYVIKESMRLYPPVPWFGRNASEDFVTGAYTIPKGSNVNVMPYHIHRNKDIYGPDANEFKPERFQDNEMANKNPYDYVPFSAGPRNCIGQKFAMMEEKVILSSVIRHFEIVSLQTRDQVHEVFDLIMHPDGQLLIGLKERK